MNIGKLIKITQMWGQKAADVIKRFSLFILITSTTFNSYCQKLAHNSITNEPEFHWKAFQGSPDPYPKVTEDSIFYFREEPKDKFENHPYKVLERFLIDNVPIPTKTKDRGIETFIFRVNSKGKIDFLESFGNINKKVRQKINLNIYKTEGHWTLPSEMADIPFRYFIFTFYSNPYLKKYNYNASYWNKISIISFVKTQLEKAVNPKDGNVIILRDLSHYYEMEKQGLIVEENY